MQNVVCNKCGKDFAPGTVEHQAVQAEGLEIEFFQCPHCGARYHVFTADAKMVELQSRRRALRQAIRLSQKKRLGRALKRLIREDEELKAEQLRLEPDLKRRGKEILKKMEDDNETNI